MIHPFNNKIETGLRVLSILNSSHPNGFDLETLVYLDYLTVHSGDFSSDLPSLHPAVPSRKGEVFVRRAVIQESLELFESKCLIEKKYTETGIIYFATENSTPFIENLNEEYCIELNIRANWVNLNFNTYTPLELYNYMQKHLSIERDNLNFNIS
ncbi:MAG: threonine transporter [Chitinophagaceae bacterium]|nr:threonine transporter [Chitinophagaceae bacterium]